MTKQNPQYLVVNHLGTITCRACARKQARDQRIPFKEKILKITIDPKTFQATTQIVR